MPTSNTEERVVIIAPVGQDAEVIATMLGAQGYQTEIASSLAEVREKLRDAGTLLLTEEALELPQVSELFRTLKDQPPWSELPLIILTGGGESHLVKLLDSIAEAARQPDAVGATYDRSYPVALSAGSTTLAAPTISSARSADARAEHAS